MEAVRAAMGKTGAEPYRPVLPTSTLAFYNCAHSELRALGEVSGLLAQDR